jgi:hypothetical protein
LIRSRLDALPSKPGLVEAVRRTLPVFVTAEARSDPISRLVVVFTEAEPGSKGEAA